jgi:hypothetical protein
MVEHGRSPAADVRPLLVAPAGAIGRAGYGLTWLAAALAMAAALAGLLVEGVYTGDVSTAGMFRGYDLVTAVVVVPGLALALRLARRGSTRARLAVSSLCAYLVYTYAYYLFGTGFNALFLMHVAVFAASLWAFVVGLIGIDAGSVAQRLGSRRPVRAIAGILGTLAVGLGGMWIYFAASNAATGTVPAGSRLVETTPSCIWGWHSTSVCSCRCMPRRQYCCGDACRGVSCSPGQP